MRALGDIDVVLASTSRYRRELLSRLTLNFRQMAPDVDEVALPNEMPQALAVRLAQAKAREVAARAPGSIVMGSDQVAECAGTILGKPGSVDKARAQLRFCSGRGVSFYTAICVIDDAGGLHEAVDVTRVHFRQLTDVEIDRYVEREQPLDCAGSFKVEGLGIGLFERIESDDPTGLIGLPLIALCRLLREAGFTVL